MDSAPIPGDSVHHSVELIERQKSPDIYFSADVETDGPIPGPFSMLSLGLVYAGSFDGHHFCRPKDYAVNFYKELKPISEQFEPAALKINWLDRNRLILKGANPEDAMTQAAEWVKSIAGSGKPVLVAYPLSFDWNWLYWYFVRFSPIGSPFNHSQCFDIKTVLAVKAHQPIGDSGRSRLNPSLSVHRQHAHNALEDAIEQAEIFANVFEWEGERG